MAYEDDYDPLLAEQEMLTQAARIKALRQRAQPLPMPEQPQGWTSAVTGTKMLAPAVTNPKWASIIPALSGVAASIEENVLAPRQRLENQAAQEAALNKLLGQRPQAEEMAGPPDPVTGLPPMRTPTQEAELQWVNKVGRFPRAKKLAEELTKDIIGKPERDQKTAFERTKFQAEERHRQETERLARERLNYDQNKPIAVNGKGLYIPKRDQNGVIIGAEPVPGSEPDAKYTLQFDDNGPYWVSDKGTALRADGTIISQAPQRGATAAAAPATANAPARTPAAEPGPASASPAAQAARGAAAAAATTGEGTPAEVVASAKRELVQVTNDLKTKQLDPASRKMLQAHAADLQATIDRGGTGSSFNGIPMYAEPPAAGAPAAQPAAAPAATQSYAGGITSSFVGDKKQFHKAPPEQVDPTKLSKTTDAQKKVVQEKRDNADKAVEGLNIMSAMRKSVPLATSGIINRGAGTALAQVDISRGSDNHTKVVQDHAAQLLEYVNKAQFGTGSGFSNTDLQTVKDLLADIGGNKLSTSQRISGYNTVVSKFEKAAGMPEGSSGLHLFAPGKRPKGFAEYGAPKE